MKAIQTVYNGYKFRSRLEARWAVFFDSLGVRYEYEPEGYVLDDGNYYLPDFWLPETYIRKWVGGSASSSDFKGVYIEIKREGSNIHSIQGFSEPIVIFHGDPMGNIFGGDDDGGYSDGAVQWDNCMKFWKCSSCALTKIEFWEGNYDCCVRSECPGRFDVIGLSYAASSARSARFEHGETP